MKRVLALHGHSGSASYFTQKLQALRKACEGEIEFVFVDAPFIMRPVDLPGLPPIERASHPDNVHTPRAWWKFTGKLDHDTDEVIKSLAYMKDVLETQGPFNGIFGYSQGASLSALICAYLENPGFSQYFSHVNHPPLEFGVFSCGFPVPSPLFPYPPKTLTPTLHIFGINDVIVLPEWSQLLTDKFANHRVEFHEGGHWVPRKRVWREFLANYFKSWAARDTHAHLHDHRDPTAPPSPTPAHYLALPPADAGYSPEAEERDIVLPLFPELPVATRVF